MKRTLKFTGALVAATLIHFVAVRLLDQWSSIIDLLLVVVVWNALDGNTVAGMFGGLGAGWLTDALTGSAFGLFGTVDTIIGYGAAFAVQHIVIQRPSGAALLFAGASACQQLLVIGLSVLLSSAPELTAYPWWFLKAGVTGLVGAALFAMNQRLIIKLDLWRRTRRTRIRMDR